MGMLNIKIGGMITFSRKYVTLLRDCHSLGGEKKYEFTHYNVVMISDMHPDFHD